MNRIKQLAGAALIISAGVVTGRAWAADAAGVVALNARITAVTVYADRARVTREAEVDIPAGALTVAFAKLPGWIDEESVRVALQPADAAEIVDVRISREFLARTTDEELRLESTLEYPLNYLQASAAAADHDMRLEIKELEARF